jgi:PAS domain S-box-containing protein
MSSVEPSGRRAQIGTFIVGPLGTIEGADDGACRLLGYAEAELVGLHGSELIPPESRAATAVSLDRMRHEQLAVRTGRMVRRDGSIFPIEVSARPLGGGRLELCVRALFDAATP